jgi:FkbM family methyltransferase
MHLSAAIDLHWTKLLKDGWTYLKNYIIIIIMMMMKANIDNNAENWAYLNKPPKYKHSLLENTKNGYKYKKWPMPEAAAYFIKGATRELHFFPLFFEKLYCNVWKKRWLKTINGQTFFDFKVAKLPDVSRHHEKLSSLTFTYEDTFLLPMLFNDSHNKSIAEEFDRYLPEGPYGYTDEDFDVTVKNNDIVIDAGAWIGDFAAYASNKGATVYAFEPVNDNYKCLCETERLNNTCGKIYPVQKGLGCSECEMNISINKKNSGANSIIFERDGDNSEKITITTLDKFVEENHIERIDFIKADIEGAERDMLRGATHVLKTFAPKLAICTYHFPEDPQVLEEIIKTANPNYKVVHLSKKLFAAVNK